MNLKDFSFTKEWTLFLDRDGVINWRVVDGYVTCWDEFRFLDGVLEALEVLSQVFGRIIVVSNQQGVGKGLMSRETLTLIDAGMKQTVKEAGGRIDASYYSPYLQSDNHPDRKPGTGMGLKAKIDFPGIDFANSIMVGDSNSDMEFGRKLGMLTVYIVRDEAPNVNADFCFKSLQDFAFTLLRIKE
jgi:histidinol-phosphate phosphatase family protein